MKNLSQIFIKLYNSKDKDDKKKKQNNFQIRQKTSHRQRNKKLAAFRLLTIIPNAFTIVRGNNSHPIKVSIKFEGRKTIFRQA